MCGTLERFEQFGDVVVRSPRLRAAEMRRVHAKDRYRRPLPTLGERLTQALVDHNPERAARTQRLGLQARSYVIIEGKSRPHIKMLTYKHHDVNAALASSSPVLDVIERIERPSRDDTSLDACQKASCRISRLLGGGARKVGPAG